MSKLLPGASLLIAVAAIVLSWMAFRTAERASLSRGAETEWLRGTTGEKLHEVERQLRGLDVAMVEIGHRFDELTFAGREGNWENAKYQTEKIRTALELALVRRPKRAESAAPFLNEDLPAIMEVVLQQDGEEFLPAMERFRTACMKCHVRENVPHFIVELPSTSSRWTGNAPR